MSSTSNAAAVYAANAEVAKQTLSDAQKVHLPGGCRTLGTRAFKNFFHSSGPKTLPSGFPVDAGYGSQELLTWFTRDNNKNFHLIPRYIQWFSECNDSFQNDAEYRGKTQNVIARFLDAVLLLTGNQQNPMGLNNFTTDTSNPPVKGIITDHKGNVLLTPSGNDRARVNFAQVKGTFFCIPLFETLPQTVNKAVCFPVVFLADTPNSTAGKFLIFTFQLLASTFDKAPSPREEDRNYTLRVMEPHALVELIQFIEKDKSISSTDQDLISRGVLQMLTDAMASTTVGQFEKSYQTKIQNFISAKLCERQGIYAANGALTGGAAPVDENSEDVQSAGNNPLRFVFADPTIGDAVRDFVAFDIMSVAGQVAHVSWEPLPAQRGFGVTAQARRIYYGYDPKYKRADSPNLVAGASNQLPDARLGWFTANTEDQDLAWIGLKVGMSDHVLYYKPVVHKSITDSVVFTVEENSQDAVLKVVDRLTVLTAPGASSARSYHHFLRRSLQNAYSSKAIAYDETKGVQGNVTLSKLAQFSGLDMPMMHALALTFVESVASRAMSTYTAGSTVPVSKRVLVTYNSALFGKADAVPANTSNPEQQVLYRSSVRDILAYFSNAQSGSLLIAMTNDSVSLSVHNGQKITILNPTGAYKIINSTHYVDVGSSAPMPTPGANAADPSGREVLGGLSMFFGFKQVANGDIAMTSFRASTAPNGLGFDGFDRSTTPIVNGANTSASYLTSMDPDFQPSNTAVSLNRLRAQGQTLPNATSSATASLSRLRTPAAEQSANRAVHTSVAASKAIVRGVVAQTVNRTK